jgi:hypothetical protein
MSVLIQFSVGDALVVLQQNVIRMPNGRMPVIDELKALVASSFWRNAGGLGRAVI